jgi:hypothetical protein
VGGRSVRADLCCGRGGLAIDVAGWGGGAAVVLVAAMASVIEMDTKSVIL